MADMQPLDHYVAQVERDFDFPEYPNSAMSTPLRIQAQAKGITVILDGSGGDEWLSGSDCHYADLVRTRRFLKLFRQVCHDRRAASGAFPSWPLLRLGLWPLMPLAMRTTIRRLSKRDGVPHWMTPKFAHQIHLTERLRLETVRRSGSSFAQEDIYGTLLSGWQSHGNEMGDRLSARLSMEERSPLNDRRIIEFACAVPDEQHWRREQSKCLLREAMKGLLPESVRNRRTKAEFSHTFAETLRTQGGSILLNALLTEELGWVRGEQVRSMYRAMIDLYGRGDSRYTHYIWPLWMIFGIEVWSSTVMDKKGERRYGAGQTPSPYRRDGEEAVCHPVPGGVR
jgi:asparagine synthase (glutamine-hydrolysing)